MAEQTYAYSPNYAVKPGSVLAEHLEVEGLAQADFAQRCGLSDELIGEILEGNAPVRAEAANAFEQVLGVAAEIWLGLESKYQTFLRCQAESGDGMSQSAWVGRFPVQELVKRGHLEQSEDKADSLFRLLTFFGVESIDAWRAWDSQRTVKYRHSPTFESRKEALATWLRLGEIEAARQSCPPFNENVFREAVQRVRELTRQRLPDAFYEARDIMKKTGVTLALIKPFKGVAASGAAWWLNSSRAIIQLSGRYKTEDHVWFSFFHEAAHILLHGQEYVFVDSNYAGDSKLEQEANEWAANMLVAKKAWERFVTKGLFGGPAIDAFAREQAIDPGIIVGRLQHEKRVKHAHVNYFKKRFEWLVDQEE